jgi:hypothetical protein
MDKLLHALTVLVAALSSVHLTLPAPVAGDQYDGGLATYGGVTAWWGSTGDPKVAHLIVRTRQGKVKALPPVLSPLAPTVDVGPAPDGEPLITYAQCGRTIATCRPYAYSLLSNEQVPLHLGADGQAVAVAVDREQVAWFREPRRDGPSQLLVGKADAFGVAHPRRVRLPRLDLDPVGMPLALDLRGGRIAFAANAAGDDIRDEALYAGTPDHVAAVVGGGYGEECTRVTVSPTIIPDALTWLRSSFGTSSCGRRHATLTRRAWSDGTLTHADVPVKAAKEAVLTADHLLVLSPTKVDGDQGDRDACTPYNLLGEDDDAHIPGCTLHVLPAPRWLPGRDG